MFVLREIAALHSRRSHTARLNARFSLVPDVWIIFLLNARYLTQTRRVDERFMWPRRSCLSALCLSLSLSLSFSLFHSFSLGSPLRQLPHRRMSQWKSLALVRLTSRPAERWSMWWRKWTGKAGRISWPSGTDYAFPKLLFSKISGWSKIYSLLYIER